LQHARDADGAEVPAGVERQQHAEAEDDHRPFTIFQGSPIVPRDSVMDTPTMKRKNGKIRSVGVQPSHLA